MLLNLLRLRPGPQHLPASARLLLILLLADVLLTHWAQSLTPATAVNGMVVTGLGFACTVLVSWLALRLRGHGPRLLQTLIALLLIGMAFTLLAAPLLMISGGLTGSGQEASGGAGVRAMLFLGLIFWSLAASGNVFRHSLSTSLAGGVLVATIILVLQAVVFDLLLPVAP